MFQPVALNAAEAQKLVDLARSKKLLLVEGVWTRFFPLVQKFRELVFKENAIGDVKHVMSDFGIARLDGKYNYFCSLRGISSPVQP